MMRPWTIKVTMFGRTGETISRDAISTSTWRTGKRSRSKSRPARALETLSLEFAAARTGETVSFKATAFGTSNSVLVRTSRARVGRRSGRARGGDLRGHRRIRDLHDRGLRIVGPSVDLAAGAPRIVRIRQGHLVGDLRMLAPSGPPGPPGRRMCSRMVFAISMNSSLLSLPSLSLSNFCEHLGRVWRLWAATTFWAASTGGAAFAFCPALAAAVASAVPRMSRIFRALWRVLRHLICHLYWRRTL